MPRRSTEQGAPGALAFTRAHGIDASWTSRSACLGMSQDPSNPMHGAWYAEPKERVPRADGTKIEGWILIDQALTVCYDCPVQWECASWFFQAREPCGTWGAAADGLRDLRDRTGQPLVAIEHARVSGIPVQLIAPRPKKLT